MTCVIVGAMPEKNLVIPENAFVIAADGGYAQLIAIGVRPNLTLGDFDSLGYTPNEEQLLLHPVEKDDTDMLLAVREGLRRGADKFLLYGGMGGRLDHTIANLQTLAFIAENGAKGILFGEGTAATVIQNGAQTFPSSAKGTVSVFSFGDKAEGVTETGLYYGVENATIENTFPIGVSNHFTGEESKASVQNGKLLILWESTAEDAIKLLSD